MKWTTSEMQDVIAKALVKNLSLSGVVKSLKCGECDCNEKYPNLDINILDCKKEI